MPDKEQTMSMLRKMISVVSRENGLSLITCYPLHKVFADSLELISRKDGIIHCNECKFHLENGYCDNPFTPCYHNGRVWDDWYCGSGRKADTGSVENG